MALASASLSLSGITGNANLKNDRAGCGPCDCLAPSSELTRHITSSDRGSRASHRKLRDRPRDGPPPRMPGHLAQIPSADSSATSAEIPLTERDSAQSAEGEGFEPSSDLTARNGFRDRAKNAICRGFLFSFASLFATIRRFLPPRLTTARSSWTSRLASWCSAMEYQGWSDQARGCSHIEASRRPRQAQRIAPS
jgi:hypothetical protein